MNRREVISLLASGLAITGAVCANPLAGLIVASNSQILEEGLKAFGGLGGELVANALQSKLIDSHPQDDILKNGDLTRAIGRAIFALCGKLAEETDDKSDKSTLEKLSKFPLDTWENLILGGGYVEGYGLSLSRIELDEIAAEKSTQYLHGKSENLDKITALTPQIWKSIIEELYKNERFSLSPATKEKLAEKLHKEFAKALRKVLIEDFSKDGKAFASMQFRLLGEILTYIQQNFIYAKETFELNDAILPIVVDLSKKVDRIIADIPKHYSSDNKNEWKPCFDKFDSAIQDIKVIREIVEKIDQRGEKHFELSTEQTELLNQILTILKADKIPQPLSTSFHPKNFPERLNYFTGRKLVLEKIVEALENHGTAALAETNGAGKSSVMIEFAYRNQDSFRHILFLRATANEFETFVSEIGDSLGFGLPNDASPAQRLSALQEWLANNDKWLLLVDNVDDCAAIKACHFNKPTGKVIYTSNNEQIYKVGTAVELPKMTDENAMLLLYKHWQDKADAKFEDIPEKYHKTLKGIAGKFGNHPFSMAFVGSYLADEDESLEEFLNAYQSKAKNLLATYKFLNNYEHPEVATAFLLRFEQISQPNPNDARKDFLSIAVTDYLKLSAYIGTDDIPEELLQQSLQKLHPDQTDLTNDAEFIKDIYRRFKPTSIFKRNAENKTLNTHRIVQEIMRSQITDEEDLILSTLADSLDDNFELFDFTNKEIVERYLSHVGVFLEYLAESRTDKTAHLKLENQSTAILCNRYACYFEQYGEYSKAEKYYVCFKEICEKVWGEDHRVTSTSYNNLGSLYHDQRKYEEAKLYHLKALAIREKVLGENHPDTAVSYNNLAALFYSLNRFKESESYGLKAIAIREKELEENHPDIAVSYNNLAGLYFLLRRYEEAEPYFLKSLAISEKKLGENHPDTAVTYTNLGGLYLEQNKLTEAKRLLEKATNIFINVLGENHLDTIDSKKWLEILEEKMRNDEK